MQNGSRLLLFYFYCTSFTFCHQQENCAELNMVPTTEIIFWYTVFRGRFFFTFGQSRACGFPLFLCAESISQMSKFSVPTLWPCLSVSPSLQCEDGAAVDGRRHLQDHLLCDERKPDSVLGLWFGPDRNRRGHPAAGPFLRPRHTGQTRLSVANFNRLQSWWNYRERHLASRAWRKPKSI